MADVFPGIIWSSKNPNSPIIPPMICSLCGAWVDPHRMHTHEDFHRSIWGAVRKSDYPTDTNWKVDEMFKQEYPR